MSELKVRTAYSIAMNRSDDARDVRRLGAAGDVRGGLVMERSRTCYECPYSYSYSDTDSYGCLFFGEECAGNKKFDDDVCYVHPKRLQFLAYRYNKRSVSFEKECTKYCTEYRKPVTSKKFVQGPFHSGYEVIVNKDILDLPSKFYRPNMKGDHTHNHVKNMELRLMLTRKEIKALRKIMKREKKK